MFPALILSVVAAALVSAAGYAVLANPHSHKGRKRKQEIINGFRLAGGVLLGFVLVATLVAGTGVAFFKLPSSRLSSRPLAFALAAVSLGCITMMVQRWAKYFAGWIGYGVLNGLMMVASGHLVNNPAIPVSRSFALMMTCLTLVSALVCLRFTETYRLNWLDKVALVGWVLAFTVAANAERYGLAAFSISCVGLLVAWLYSRSLRRPKVKHSHETAVT